MKDLNVVCVSDRKTTWVWKPKVEVELALRTITSSDPLREFVLPIPWL